MSLLQEGDIIELRKGHEIYANIPKHFIYQDSRGDFTLVQNNVVINDDTDYLSGTYIVIKTTKEGKSHNTRLNDEYSDGYRVYCAKANDRSIEVNFYQTGNFSAMIKNITPTGKTKLKWILASTHNIS